MKKVLLLNILWLYKEIYPFKIYLFMACIFSTLSAFASIVPIICIFELTKLLQTQSLSQDAIKNILLIAIVAIMLRFCFYLLAMMFSHKVAFKFNYEIKMKIAHHLGLLPLGFFRKNPSGKLKKTINDDIELLELFFGHYLPDLMAGVSLFLFAFIYLFNINIFLSLLIMLPMFSVLLAHKMMMRVYNQNIANYHQVSSEISSRLLEFINAIQIIKTFGNHRFFTRYNAALNEHSSIVEQWTQKSKKPSAFFKLSLEFGLILILVAGSIFLILKMINLGVFVLFLLFSISIFVPFERLFMIITYLSQINQALSSIKELLKEKTIYSASNKNKIKDNSIEFKNVSFAYDKQEVLHNISFKLEEKSHTFIIGQSGAGKSTLAQLIARFWDIKNGEILLGGKNIQNIDTKILYKKISFVFQDVFLLNASVMENLKIANPNISKEQAINAAKYSAAHSFIKRLKNGYDTQIGENGAFLSGGEKQRLSIARMIIKDSPIVILDEAIAWTDVENEFHIQKALQMLTKGKTLISITHKLQNLKDKDKVLLLEDGNLVFHGIYEDAKKTTNFKRIANV